MNQVRRRILLVASLLLIPIEVAGCSSDCDDRPPPCADESFYSLAPPGEPARPLGAATVSFVGPDSVELQNIETGELIVFRLPVEPALERGDEVTIEAAFGYLVRRAGEPVFFSGGGQQLIGPRPRVDPVAGIDVQPVQFCREPAMDDQCFFGTTVFALDVGEVQIEPGATREVELPDGRVATVRNRLTNQGTSSCQGCLDLPPSNFLVDIVFH